MVRRSLHLQSQFLPRFSVLPHHRLARKTWHYLDEEVARGFRTTQNHLYKAEKSRDHA